VVRVCAVSANVSNEPTTKSKSPENTVSAIISRVTVTMACCALDLITVCAIVEFVGAKTDGRVRRAIVVIATIHVSRRWKMAFVPVTASANAVNACMFCHKAMNFATQLTIFVFSCESTEEGRYSGRYCEKCPTCSGRCQEFKDCVQCQMYKTGLLAKDDDCAANCTLFTPIAVEKVEIEDEKDEHICTFYDEDDCRFQFIYNDREEGKIVVRAQQDRECPPKVFMLGIVLGVIAAIVLIGLAVLLLWKLLTTIHDRREFARFEKERMMAKWDTVSLECMAFCLHTKFKLKSCILGRKSHLQTSDIDIQKSHVRWKIDKTDCCQ
jgi:Integrin beta tail domain/Integrin beta cytoplasmic domain